MEKPYALPGKWRVMTVPRQTHETVTEPRDADTPVTCGYDPGKLLTFQARFAENICQDLPIALSGIVRFQKEKSFLSTPVQVKSKTISAPCSSRIFWILAVALALV